MVKVNILDDSQEFKKIDSADMHQYVSSLPEMIGKAKDIAKDVTLKDLKEIKEIVITGMGGSAIGGDIAKVTLSELPIPITVNRDYTLPKYIGKGSLLFAISYSGNTEETLSSFKEASARGIDIISIASSGQLKELSHERGYPIVLIPSGLQPRAAIAYLAIPILVILERLHVVKNIEKDILESIALLKKLREQYAFLKEERTNPVKQLARKLNGKIPVIFGTSNLTGIAALRWKTQLNENSKMTALLSVFPELNHNEIVNLSALKKGEHNFSLVILRDKGEGERLKKRIEVTKSLIGESLGGLAEVFSLGNSPLARILSLIYFGDFLSVYLAVLANVDPTPVKIIERLKKEMAR